MKQILIEKTDTIKDLYGTNITLLAQEDSTFEAMNPTTLRLDLKIKPISGKGTFDINFKQADGLAQAGVALLGVSREADGTVVASFMKIGATAFVVTEGQPLLVGTLFEPVSYRQIEMEVAGGTVNVVKSQEGQGLSITPTKKRKGKKL
jgi:hypothetical protein